VAAKRRSTGKIDPWIYFSPDRAMSAAAAFQGQAYISGASLYLILPLKTIAHVFRESASQHLH
jgi:hypothetical protein